MSLRIVTLAVVAVGLMAVPQLALAGDQVVRVTLTNTRIQVVQSMENSPEYRTFVVKNKRRDSGKVCLISDSARLKHDVCKKIARGGKVTFSHQARELFDHIFYRNKSGKTLIADLK